MSENKKVHIRNLNGRLLYNILLDDGGPFLPFGGLHPYGGLPRSTIKRERMVVCEGWLTIEEMEAERNGMPETSDAP